MNNVEAHDIVECIEKLKTEIRLRDYRINLMLKLVVVFNALCTVLVLMFMWMIFE